MNRHPSGEAHTEAMLEHVVLPEGAGILDMGAGAGETVRLLRRKGLNARGIDLLPRSPLVEKGDLLHTGFPEKCFDAVISQCAFFVSGNVFGALREAHRILKTGGFLLLSDVFTEDPIFRLQSAGFAVLYSENLTGLWREYYLEALWKEDAACSFPHGKCTYWMLIGRRNENGSV